MREPVAGDAEQARADVYAAGYGTALLGQDEGKPRAAAHVEDGRSRADDGGVEDGLEQRPVVRLGQLRPGPWVGAPQAALDLGGHCATVGLGGFLLQGGQGWDSRARGWACQSVVGLDVVTADGRLVRADAGQNCDLLWAARGAGPGFPGVITRFRLQTYPAPRAMWHDTRPIRLDDTVKLLGWLHDVLPGLDRRVEPVVAATRLPDVPLYDGADRPDGTVLLLHTTVMADSDAEALALLAPLQDGPLAGSGPDDAARIPQPARQH